MSPEEIFDLECQCRYCKDQRIFERINKGFKFVGGLLVTTFLCEVAILAAPAALGLAGYGAREVRAVSWATRARSWIGNIWAGRALTTVTSTAARRTLSPAAASGIRAVFHTIYLGGAAAGSLVNTDKDGDPAVPDTEEAWDNLINEAISRGLICGECMKRCDSMLRGLCESVCKCGLLLAPGMSGYIEEWSSGLPELVL
ncbi:uncharacterized protein LOC100909046 [Galendromus occidentalis]|uniref:Uncharacterized protein LOC100909046 n=1 Tax=Galendromus occidentalis TaxID=34638 RepID=A0AAJ6QMB1_9ACAR|nr:uncharacterized protein LOC100909046 [Galendromus occidentalis]